MGLYENFQFHTAGFKGLRILASYEDPDFASNEGGICGGHALYWLGKCAGTVKSGKGVRAPLLGQEQKAASIHFSDLRGGQNSALAQKSDSTIRLVGTNDAKGLRSATPWTGTYKIYEIASSKGMGHFMGAYFPWIGNPQFYDPNLAVCEIPKDSFFDFIACWRDIYDNVGGSGTWGFEFLYVVRPSEL